jgi:membrane-associated phospholipid phosphatase
MPLRVAALCVAACLTCPAVTAAQTVSDLRPAAGAPAAPVQAVPDSFWTPFKAVPDDFARLFTTDTVRILSLGAAGALAAHQWDGKGIEEASEHFRPPAFTLGNVGGGFLIQAGAGFALYSVAKLSGSDQLSSVGADLVRAQILSQGLVQIGKFATRRSRPDGSDRYSLPSGHTASAFATATVLQDHFGWKVGVPAYAFGAYVAASRMSANKHHLSDVLFGAAIGIASARTVTIGSGHARFNMGVAPTVGGAMVTFTKP